ncbi:MAG: hypothetical protein HOV94_33170 [Saccharothrix sp.]|nr:hypothetical protein [Saccharothrix sp.]
MNATPPGVEELDPARLDPEELDREFAEVREPVDEPDLPPATPSGHHQTHSAPVDADSAAAADD